MNPLPEAPAGVGKVNCTGLPALKEVSAVIDELPEDEAPALLRTASPAPALTVITAAAAL
jgi:hypothetical protein